jgi:SET domain-containing protein
MYHASIKRIFKTGNYRLRVGKTRTGKGMYVQEPIAKGVCIIEYTGRPATMAQQKANTGKYLFWTSDTTMIDGNIPTNKARFINHSCRPNCEIDIKNKRIFVFAVKNIKPGEELTYDYGEEYFEMYFANGRCRCQKCSPK